MMPVFDRVRPLTRSWWLAMFLLLQVAGITQLYPYVHLHHIHEENGTRIALHGHPVGVGETVLDEVDDEEHHHAGDHIVFDYHFCQRLLQQLQRQADAVELVVLPVEPPADVLETRSVDSHPSLCASRPLAPHDLRGPPAPG